MNGKRLKRLRKELGLSGENIAQALDTTRVTVSRWESGASEPSDKKKIALAKILNTSVAYLMGETDNPTPITNIDTNQLEQGNSQDVIDYAYWGGVVNNVRKLLTLGDERAISSITPLMKLAYEMLSQYVPMQGAVIAQMPILGNNNNHNTQNVRIATK